MFQLLYAQERILHKNDVRLIGLQLFTQYEKNWVGLPERT